MKEKSTTMNGGKERKSLVFRKQIMPLRYTHRGSRLSCLLDLPLQCLNPLPQVLALDLYSVHGLLHVAG